MRQAFPLLLFCSTAVLVQAAPYTRLNFEEPVVLESQIGTDTPGKYTLSVDDTHRPQCRWVDQDRLAIKFAPGTSVFTEFKLEFKEGQDKYLSGESMEQAEFRFFCPRSELTANRRHGYPTATFCVYPESTQTKEAREFSVSTPVRYEFREIADIIGGKIIYGRTVEAELHPAKLGEVNSPETALALLAETSPDWSKVHPDTLIPGMIMVRATEPLLGSAKWELHITPTEESGLVTEERRIGFSPEAELGTGVSQFIRRPAQKSGKKDSMQVEISFSSPINVNEREQIFRAISIRAKGQEAKTNGDTKTLTIDGKEATFRLLPHEKIDVGAWEYTIREEGPKETILYEEHETVLSFLLEVNLPAATELEVIIPKGTRAANGLSTVCDHLHRLSFNPAVPMLSGTHTDLLPLKGKLDLRLNTLNAESLEVKVHRLNAENYLRWKDELSEISADDLVLRDRLNAHFQLAAARIRQKDKADSEAAEKLRLMANMLRQETQENARVSAHIQSILRQLPSFEQKTIHLPTDGENPLIHSQEICLNLNELTGGTPLPGFYVLSIKPTLSPAVRELAQSLHIDPKELETQRLYHLQVTDLMVNQENGQLIVTRLSDGSLAKNAEVLRADGFSKPLPEGYTTDFPRPNNTSVVRVGEDFVPLNSEEEEGREEQEESDIRMYILHDRPLYRPGETVHLRGIIRRMTENGECETDASLSRAQLTVYRANEEILLQQEITADELGTWQYSFTLPNGEEDITGNYRVVVHLPGTEYSAEQKIPCEFFRRNAFQTKWQLRAPLIAPGEFTAELHAADLNGTPLSRAEVEVHVNSGGPGISLQPNGKPEKTIRTTLHTDERGIAELRGYFIGDFPPLTNGVARLSISGSVANDRQEYRETEGISTYIYAADFRADLNDDTLRLYAVSDDDAIHERTLRREQKLRIRILGHVYETQQLSDYISKVTIREQCLDDREWTVPANCENGVVLPLKELCKKAVDSFPLRILISGTDSSGRIYNDEWRHDFIEEEEEENEDEDDESCLSCTHREGALEVELNAPRAGEALLLINSRSGARIIPLTVKGGEESFTIPLHTSETGSLVCHLLQTTRDSMGWFSRLQSDLDALFVPRPEMQLNLTLCTPTEDLRPGSETELWGQVTLPDGTPADAVVTLVAVDKGMSTPYEYMPDITDFFGSTPFVSLEPFGHRGLRWNDTTPVKFTCGYALLHQLWPGAIVGSGRDIEADENDDFLAEDEEIEYAPLSWGGSTDGDEEEEAEEEEGFDDEEDCSETSTVNAEEEEEGEDTPRIRRDFSPVAVWQAALKTDAEGKFSTQFKLPDTLTSYCVFAVAASRCGKRFGQAEGDFRVNQPVMITPGTPLFMSLGDCLRLPLTITNNTGKDGTWNVSLAGAAAPQNITLKAGSTGTLFFEFTAAAEGENTLRWTATAAAGGDAVEGTFPVRFPAPVLKETYHLIQAAGAEPLKLAALPAAELAESERGSVQLELSANPLLHLASAMDFVLSYPYGCTEQTASGLLPWIFHSRLAPFSPTMQDISPQEVSKVITQAIEKLFQRQVEDGGLGYWEDSDESCLWASAHAALVFTLAEENGISLPEEKMKALRYYLATRNKREMKNCTPFTRYSIGRVCGNQQLIRSALEEILSPKNTLQGRLWAYSALEDIRFIAALRQNPEQRHEAFLNWMRSRGRDYRHASTWQSGWMLVALGEYLRLEPEQAASATVQLQDGTQMTLGNGITRYTPPAAAKLRELPTVITTTQGTAYLNVKFRALPNKTEYPGVTEKGLQVTRVYEIKDTEGNWKPATEFRVGDEVRVTLTCTKAAPELEYFVLEDYLPACMEAINPNVTSQSNGWELPWNPWFSRFDHKEYLADRVRGFCNRWRGQGKLNMSYYARVKRAGISTAPPAEAQLMYEPQTYGLSPNTTIISR
ncbi:MAG: hypothetical protein E7034_07580 [Akkermansiaceae bacterium]|nr:hypothetical protein [Akkermansiaceae bacterium]